VIQECTLFPRNLSHVSDIKSGTNLTQILGDSTSGFCVPCVIRRRQIPFTFPLIRYSSSYKALQPMQGSALLNHFLPAASILCYFLPVAYVHALYIFQNVIFPICFRSSNWSFRHGFLFLDLLHIIFSQAFIMA
jgi:hypothetical protein